MHFITPFLLSSLVAFASSNPVAVETLGKRANTISVTEGKGWYVYANGSPFLTLSNGQTFYLQNDGNFVAYQGSTVLFASGTGKHNCPTGSRSCELIFQTNGNLVVYISGQAVWNSKTADTGNTLSFNNGDIIDIYNSAGGIVYCDKCGSGYFPPPPCGGGKRELGAELEERCVYQE